MASNSPIFAPDVQDINRRRQMAQALIAQGTSTPTGTEYAGGAAVRNSPILGIGNLLAAALGAYKKKGADEDYNKALSTALSGIQSQPGTQAQPQAESPQISNVPQGTSAPNPPQNSDVGGMGTMPPQIAQQPAPQPQPAQPMSQTGALPQAQAQGTPQLSMEQIMRMQQFPELKGYADMQLKQLQDRQAQDYKFGQEQQAAVAADQRARAAHQTDRTFDVQNPTDKTPAAVQEYEYAKGQGYNGSFTDYQKQQKTAVAQFHMDNPTAPQLGDPADDTALAHGIATGQLPPLTGMASRSPRAGKIMAMVLKENPQYRGTDYGTSAAAEKFFTSGKGGQTLRSLDVAHAHLDTLAGLATALQNGNIPLVNKLSNAVATQTGGAAPASFDAAKRIVSDEIAKAIVGGATALGDREEAARSISSAQTPAQLAGVIKTYQELMRGQIGGLADQYKNSTNRDDFYTRFSLKSNPGGGQPAAPGVVRKKYNPATGMIE